MKEKTSTTKTSSRRKNPRKKDNLNGYPPYPAEEDIYGKYQKDKNVNPEDPALKTQTVSKYKTGIYNEMDFDENVSGSDLDVPGSEIDDELEIIGNEDEENNYYSLGGDDHNDLDEDYVE